MSGIYLDLKQKLEQWQPAIVSSNDQSVEWQLPTELEHGLFTTNIAFLLAKSLRQNPNQIATDLQIDLNQFLDANQLPLESDQVGPYLNLKLKNNFFAELIKSETLTSPAQKALNKVGKTVLLDYVSPNVAKPLHAGHIRNANLGESLRRLFTLKYKTDLRG
jgi:arginyl-tRNA synthetase